ncbi:T9SS type A sorting domain-containing protein [Hymenobacter algoricola]|uniref:T9SS type A sorting domain-containing protein n=1 Tax=Hymenobacter algoricola TaxID=486267 RepID=UPI003CD069BE
MSSTVSVYNVQTRGTVTATAQAPRAAPLRLYPNPTQHGRVYLSRPVSGTLHDMTGRPVRTLRQAAHLESAGLAPGVYVLRTNDGVSAKLVVQ